MLSHKHFKTGKDITERCPVTVMPGVCAASRKRVSVSFCGADWWLHRMKGQSYPAIANTARHTWHTWHSVHSIHLQSVSVRSFASAWVAASLVRNLAKLFEVFFGLTSRSTQIILCDMASDMLTVWKRNGKALAKPVSRLKRKLEANIN